MQGSSCKPRWVISGALATSSTAGSQCRLTCHAASISALRKFNSVPQKFENFVNKTLRCALCSWRKAGAGRAGARRGEIVQDLWQFLKKEDSRASATVRTPRRAESAGKSTTGNAPRQAALYSASDAELRHEVCHTANAAAAACAKLACSVAQRGEQARTGSSSRNSNKSGFVNCPADVCLSSRWQRRAPCSTSTSVTSGVLVDFRLPCSCADQR